MFDATTKPTRHAQWSKLKRVQKNPDPIKSLKSHSLLIQSLLALGSFHLCLKS